MFKIKISLADKLFSLYIRHRDKLACVRCGRKHRPEENTCDNSHYWGRGMGSVKFDPENCDTLCKYPCHAGTDPKKLGWEYQKQIKGRGDAKYDGDYTLFKINQLGQKKFDALLVRAHTTTKTNEKEIVIGLKILLKEMGVNLKKKGPPLSGFNPDFSI